MRNGVPNIMRREAERAVSQWARTRIGIVDSYDPNHYAVKVRLQPEDALTGWIPVVSHWVGNGWGLYSPPSIGNVIEVHFQEGGKEAAFAGACFFSTVTQPLAVSSGELWLVHQSGTFIKLTNDQKLLINGQIEIDATAPTINITATSVVNVTAPAIKLGSAGETLHQIVTDALVALFNTHTHSGVQVGGGNTGAPNQTMGSSHLTTVTQAG